MFGVSTTSRTPRSTSAGSPISYVQRITTPLLIVHSEDDLRCPIEQAEQLFVALRLLGKEVELVRFPAENHELSRSGSPVHRVQRAEIILEFFGKHLQARGHRRRRLAWLTVSCCSASSAPTSGPTAGCWWPWPCCRRCRRWPRSTCPA